MSGMIYISRVEKIEGKPLVWLSEKIKTPPFSFEARQEAGTLLRKLQNGLRLTLPHSRQMQNIGSRCHELRIKDGRIDWRIFYRLDDDAIVIIEIANKKTRETPDNIKATCKARLKYYDRRS